MLDTLDYSESLTDAGVPANQARVHAKALSEAVESNNFATSVDIARLETTISSEVARLETTISSEVARLETTISSEVTRLETTISSEVTRLESQMTVMESKFDVMDSKFTASFVSLDSKFTVQMSEMKFELIKWGVGMVFALSGIMFALLRFMLP